MFRIKVVEESQAQGPVKEGYEAMRLKMGVVPNAIKLFSLWPEAFQANMQFFETLMLSSSELDNATKEMIALTVSKLNQCQYCVSHHANFLKQYGIDETIAGQITDDYHNAALDEKTKSVLAFAEKLTRNAYTVTDENVQTLRNQGWSDRQILEATLIAGHFNFINRVVDGLGVELEIPVSADN